MSGEKRPLNVSGNQADNSLSKKFKAGLVDLEELKCPICLELPKGDVFLCSNGHSVCNECMAKLDSCPTCRVPYQRGPGKIRNHFAEGILSKMLFECTWKAEGCDREGLSRQELSEHEAECQFNPTPVKLCHIFFLNNCPYEVSPTFLKTSSAGLPSDFLDHVRNAHSLEKMTAYPDNPFCCWKGKRSFMEMRFNLGRTADQSKLIYLKERNKPRATIGLYVIFSYVIPSGTDFNLFWFAVRIGDKPDSCDVTLRMTLNGTSRETEDGDGLSVETFWNAKIMSVQEFYQFKKKPPGDKDQFTFSIPWSRVKEYYLNGSGNVDLWSVFSVTENGSSDETTDSSSSDSDSTEESSSD